MKNKYRNRLSINLDNAMILKIEGKRRYSEKRFNFEDAVENWHNDGRYDGAWV